MGKSLKVEKDNKKLIITKELIGMTIILFSMLSLFCLITGDVILYPVGGIVQKFIYGVSGYFSYPIFIFTLLFSLLLVIGKKVEDPSKIVQAVLLILLFIFLFCIVHLAMTAEKGNISSTTFAKYLVHCYNQGQNGLYSSTAGGAVLSIIVYPVVKLASVFGAYCLFGIIIASITLALFRHKIFTARQNNSNTENQKVVKAPINKQTINQYDLNKKPVSNNKRLVIGDDSFKMKSSSTSYAETPLNQNTDNYQPQKLKTLKDYVMQPQIINPDNLGKVVNTSFGVSEEIPLTIKKEEPIGRLNADYINDIAPNEDIYIPDNYKNTKANNQVKNVQPQELFTSKPQSKEDVYNSFNNDASDDTVVDRDIDIITDIENEPSNRSTVKGWGFLGKNKQKGLQIVDDNEVEDSSVADIKPLKRTILDKKADVAKGKKEQNDVVDVKKEMHVQDGVTSYDIQSMPLNFKYKRPPIDLLKDYFNTENESEIEQFKEEKAQTIINILKVLGGVEAKLVNVVHGPAVTRFDVLIPDNVPMKSVTKLTEDLTLRLKVKHDIRISKVPLKDYIGIEVPNAKQAIVGLKEIVTSRQFTTAKSNSIVFALGKDIIGNPVTEDIAKMPHLLIAGSTGTGKSVCLNTMLISLLMKYGPEELRFVIVDPKQVEFAAYEGIPHMMFDRIFYDSQGAIAMLNWAIKEMENRYSLFRSELVHNLEEYNAQIDPRVKAKLPKIVIIIDEFADLMSMGSEKKALENCIGRLAQKARAAGMHLILATQRPSVNVMEGSIKTNFVSRIAFKTSNYTDSQTILGEPGAERLLGKGDLLYRTSSMPDCERTQGGYISNEEIKSVISFIKQNNICYFDEKALQEIEKELAPQEPVDNSFSFEIKYTDTPPERLYLNVLKYAVENKLISGSSIMRKFGVGFPKAGKIMDWLEANNYISLNLMGKQRQVIMTKEQFEEKYGTEI